MFLGLRNTDSDQHFNTCWEQLELGFKFLLFFTFALNTIILMIPVLSFFVSNPIFITVTQHQFWRPFTAFAYQGTNIGSFLNLLFDFYFLYMLIPEFERKLSTVYIVLEFFLQLFLCNLALLLLYPLIVTQIISSDVMGMGLSPVIFSFLWKKVAENPEQHTKFCCCPCLVPLKFVPLLFIIILMMFGGQLSALLIYCLMGYLQFMVLGKPLLRLPLRFYRKIDAWMCESVKEKRSYTKVSSVQVELKKVCLSGCCPCPWRNNQGNTELSTVEILGSGVAIGSSSPEKNFKSFWVEKNPDSSDEEELYAKGGPELQSDENYGVNESKQKPQLGNSFEQFCDEEGNILSQRSLSHNKN